jgi:selenocysteine lyase/cysteine desulfurase
MGDRTGRRRFLKQLLAGTAVVTARPNSRIRRDAGGQYAASFPHRSLADYSDQERWRLVREQFLLQPGYVYLNAAGLGPSPLPVIDAVDRSWRELELQCETGHSRRDGPRQKLCALMNCAEHELALTRNATEGMNLAARGIELDHGAQVLMTTHEHPGGAMPWFAAAQDHDISIETFTPGLTGEETMARFSAALTSRTRVVMVSHVTCTLGAVLPVKEIVDLCRNRGIVSVIDGAQAPGQVSVDLHDLGCDFYVASGHKFLLGPKGTGFLFVREEMLDRWRPSYVGAYSDALFDLTAGRFERRREAPASEYGTRNTPLVLGLGAAIDFLTTIGLERVADRSSSLARRLRGHLDRITDIELLTPSDPQASAAILTFRLPGSVGDPWDWCNLLRQEFGIRLRPVGEAGLMAVRAATHVFNDESDVDSLGEVLRQLV